MHSPDLPKTSQQSGNLNNMLKRFFQFLPLLLVMVAGIAHSKAVLIPAAPQLSSSAYILIDADTGKVIVEHNADEQLPPASLTKMMTIYVVAGEMDRGNLKGEDLVTISEKAWRKGGSKMFVEVNTKVPVIDLIRGVVIQSGNDASIALAEHVAGSEDAFADVMNQQAVLLGMENTFYRNATGWPDPEHLTTARDLSLLARSLIMDYPEHYSIYSEKYFTYNEIRQPNRNRLLWRDNSVDGVKTGHTEEAGYCLVSSAKKNNMRLISVVMGTKSEDARAAESQKLLAYGFRYYENVEPYGAGAVLKQTRVWGGLVDQVNLGLTDKINLTIPRGSQSELQAQMEVNKVIKAPIKQGDELGRLVISLNGEELVNEPLVAMGSVEQAGFFARLWDAIKLFFLEMFGKV